MTTLTTTTRTKKTPRTGKSTKPNGSALANVKAHRTDWDSESASSFKYGNPPQKLGKTQFYGLCLDDDQQAFVDAIWDDDVRIVFCDSKAGTGKTT